MPASRIARAAAVATAVAALAGGLTFAQAGPAAAGAVCTVSSQGQAPIHTEPRASPVAHWINPGTPVGATTENASFWRVYRADNGAHLGYMSKSDLNCDAG